MLFSTATGYALRALAALPEDGSFSLAKDLSSKLELPGPYLAKILQGLVQADILESVRDPKGGFRFTRPSREDPGEFVHDRGHHPGSPAHGHPPPEGSGRASPEARLRSRSAHGPSGKAPANPNRSLSSKTWR